ARKVLLRGMPSKPLCWKRTAASASFRAAAAAASDRTFSSTSAALFPRSHARPIEWRDPCPRGPAGNRPKLTERALNNGGPWCYAPTGRACPRAARRSKAAAELRQEPRTRIAFAALACRSTADAEFTAAFPRDPELPECTTPFSSEPAVARRPSAAEQRRAWHAGCLVMGVKPTDDPVGRSHGCEPAAKPLKDH